MLNVIKLNVVMLNVIMLSFDMLSVIMLNAVTLNVVMLNVVAPAKNPCFSSLSVFEYFHSKLSKMESIMGQILCEMMTSQAGSKKQKSEDELISGIIFKVFSMVQGETLLGLNPEIWLTL